MRTDAELRQIIRSGLRPIHQANPSIRKYEIDGMLVIAQHWNCSRWGERIYIRHVYQQDEVIQVAPGDLVNWHPAAKSLKVQTCTGRVRDVLPDNMLIVGYQLNLCGKYRTKYVRIGDWQVFKNLSEDERVKAA